MSIYSELTFPRPDKRLTAGFSFNTLSILFIICDYQIFSRLIREDTSFFAYVKPFTEHKYALMISLSNCRVGGLGKVMEDLILFKCLSDYIFF